MFVLTVKIFFLVLLTRISLSKGEECPPTWLDCGNGKCIASIWVCDGDDNCENFNDEKDCEITLPAMQCLSTQFECLSDKHCIPEGFQCDRDQDCEDGSDEKHCDSFTRECTGFTCRNNICILESWRCDGQEDCSDGSDEEFCPQGKLCADSEFLCTSGSCVNRSLVCNGRNDCADGSDEGSHCGDPCDNTTCSHNCKNTAVGPHCYCNEGYVLDKKDNKTCIDVDECQEEGFCSHKCLNTDGSYKCICEVGYELVNRTCRAIGMDPLLIFSTEEEIYGMHLRSKQYFPILRAMDRSSAVDIDPKNERIYWIETSKRSSVYSSRFDGSDLRTVLSHGLLDPEDIAVDYVANNIYLTDPGLHQVLACKMDGTMCYVLHDKSVEKPISIVLDIDNGLMYWSDWGEQSAGIYRSGMDGSRRTSLVSNRIGWPNCIAIDHTTNRLYWADVKLNTIEFITLDGYTRKEIPNCAPFHPYSMTVFEDNLYWSDLTFSLESCNKFNGNNMTVVALENGRLIMGVQVYHPVLAAKASNPCWSHDCSHLCLISPANSFRCACPEGLKLSVDQKTCRMEEHRESLFVSEGSRVFYVRPKSVGSDSVVQLLLTLGEAVISRVSYDSKSRYLFVADVLKPAIYAVNLTSLHLQELVGSNLTSPEDLSFDWMSNNLYWIDSSERTVDVISITLLRRATLLKELMPPVALAISPADGYMFVATSDIEAPVTMYGMDGKHKKVLSVIQGMLTSLAIHPAKSILYWTDQRSGIISHMNYSSFNSTQIVKTGIDGVMSIGVSEDYIYWTSKNRELNMLKENLTHVLELPGEDIGSVSRKVAYSSGKISGMSGCFMGNGGCSYVCLTSPIGRSCACPSEMVLADDNATCVEVPIACSEDEVSCMDGECISRLWLCDDDPDCEDADDEAICNVTLCSNQNQFRCDDGLCVPIIWACDGHEDCYDGSDEKNCSVKGESCSENEFRCVSDGACINELLKCDGKVDCFDTSDEKNCSDLKFLDVPFEGKEGEIVFLSEGSTISMHNFVNQSWNTSLFSLNSVAVVTGMSYDSKSRQLFISDVNTPAIYAINMTSLLVRDLEIKNMSSPEDIAFDWMSNNLYWVDSSKGTVDVVSIFSLKSITLVTDLVRPVSLAISPNHGNMFIATIGDENLVTMFDMDGKNRRILFSVQGLLMSLTLHPSKSILYWADPRAGMILYTNYTSSSPPWILKSGIPGVVSLAAGEEYVYWTVVQSVLDETHGSVHGLKLSDEENRNGWKRIAYSSGKNFSGKSECLIQNGGCNHLCITSPNGRTCACPSEMTLGEDKKTCSGKRCDDIDFKCDDGQCVPAELRCNGIEECNDGSDETDCDSAEGCGGGMHRCNDGACVYNYQVCDGIYDCRSQDDEIGCESEFPRFGSSRPIH